MEGLGMANLKVFIDPTSASVTAYKSQQPVFSLAVGGDIEDDLGNYTFTKLRDAIVL